VLIIKLIQLYKKSERVTGINPKNFNLLNSLSLSIQVELNTETVTENFIYSSKRMSSPRPFNSCINTLNDSGNPGSGIDSPLTIAS